MANSNLGAHEPLLKRPLSTSPSRGSGSGSSSATRVEDASRSAAETSLTSNALLSAQGHEAVMERSFSPAAALGLGFR